MKRKIAFVSRNPSSYAQRVMQGVIRYAAAKPDLQLQLLGRVGFEPLWDAEEFQGDGVIGMFREKKEAEPFLAKGMHVVNISAATDELQPWVCIDNKQVGKMAADFFVSRGFSNCVYLSSEIYSGLFNMEREVSFQRTIENAGGNCQIYDLGSSFISSKIDWQEAVSNLKMWLQSQSKPLALFCVCDVIARIAIRAANEAGLSIPNQVAIVSVDNDEVLCQSISPTISSIEQNEERVGYEVAKLLDNLVQGTEPENRVIRLEPLELIERQSTGAVVIEDEHVRQALKIMQTSFYEPIQILDVLEQIHLSRRELEKRFKKYLGRSPAQELLRLRIIEAKRLLSGTKNTLKEVASLCGFKRPERFHEAFKRVTGETPLSYRKRNI